MKSYIQIGANVGDDDFQRLIESVDERVRLILIEPNIDLIDELTNNYSNLKNKHEIIIIPSAISTTNGTFKFYLRTDMKHFGGASLLNRKGYDLNIIREVAAITFDKLCENYSIDVVEYLCIDTEALDYEILNSIDLSKVNIKTIFFEKWDSGDEDLNENFKNGINFLNKFIVPKYKDFKWEIIIMDEMPTYKLTKL